VVEFSVQDTGVGIRPEDHAKIFTAFTQVDAANPPSGKAPVWACT